MNVFFRLSILCQKTPTFPLDLGDSFENWNGQPATYLIAVCTMESTRLLRYIYSPPAQQKRQRKGNCPPSSLRKLHHDVCNKYWAYYIQIHWNIDQPVKQAYTYMRGLITHTRLCTHISCLRWDSSPSRRRWRWGIWWGRAPGRFSPVVLPSLCRSTSGAPSSWPPGRRKTVRPCCSWWR